MVEQTFSQMFFPTLHKLLRLRPRDFVRLFARTKSSCRAVVGASTLPDEARQLITRVVVRTRLWRREQVEVSQELVSHFLDGIEQGEMVARLLERFGDERTSAKLIRRAKIRNRSLAWHAFRWVRFGVFGLLVVYLGLTALFLSTHPSPRVDYVAEFNRPLQGVPESDRGWPLYRAALIGLRDYKTGRFENIDRYDLPELVDSRVDGKHWSEYETWLRVHATDIETLRRATQKPVMGFVLGPDGSINDAQLWYHMGENAKREWAAHPSVINVLLPHLTYVRGMAEVLQADTKLATLDRDGERAERNVIALLDLAAHLHGNDPTIVTGFVALGIQSLACDTLERVLLSDPALLRDDQFVHLAHRLAVPRTASDLMSLGGERIMFNDSVQRMYTDDGHGDGHITAEGFQFLSRLYGLTGTAFPDRFESTLALAAGPGMIVAAASRKELVDRYNRLMDLNEANLRRPRREVDLRPVEQLRFELTGTTLAKLKYGMVSSLIPALDNVGVKAERLLGRRDGILIAITLELFHRKHGVYPERLDELVPTLLPTLPLDRITGDSVRYKLVAGKPLVYSVGSDRVDDGGTPPTKARSMRDLTAANWGADAEKKPKGDWVLFPMPRPAEVEDE